MKNSKFKKENKNTHTHTHHHNNNTISLSLSLSLVLQVEIKTEKSKQTRKKPERNLLLLHQIYFSWILLAKQTKKHIEREREGGKTADSKPIVAHNYFMFAFLHSKRKKNIFNHHHHSRHHRIAPLKVWWLVHKFHFKTVTKKTPRRNKSKIDSHRMIVHFFYILTNTMWKSNHNFPRVHFSRETIRSHSLLQCHKKEEFFFKNKQTNRDFGFFFSWHTFHRWKRIRKQFDFVILFVEFFVVVALRARCVSFEDSFIHQ